MSRTVLVLNVVVLLVTTFVAFQSGETGSKILRAHARTLEMPLAGWPQREPARSPREPGRDAETPAGSKARFLSYANSLPELGSLTAAQLVAIDRALTICCTELPRCYDVIREGMPQGSELRSQLEQVFTGLRVRVAGMLAGAGMAETPLRDKLVEVLVACAS